MSKNEKAKMVSFRPTEKCIEIIERTMEASNLSKSDAIRILIESGNNRVIILDGQKIAAELFNIRFLLEKDDKGDLYQEVLKACNSLIIECRRFIEKGANDDGDS